MDVVTSLLHSASDSLDRHLDRAKPDEVQHHAVSQSTPFSPFRSHWSLTTLVTESTLSEETSRQVAGDLYESLAVSESRIAKRDFIRTIPAARIAAISDRRAGADKEDGETVESNSHLHGLGRYNWRLEDRQSQPQRPLLSVGIPGAGSK